MPLAHGGMLVARQLARLGIDTVFGLVGGHLGPIYDACLDLGIRIVGVRHEDAAVHMACAYARLRRRVGVALVTAGPGVTNAMSGIANAWSGRIPIMVIAGRWPTLQEHLGAFHEVDQASLVRPISRWAGTCGQPQRIPEYVVLAWRAALSGGPAFLDIPSDVLRSTVDETTVWFPAAGPPRHPAAPSQEAIQEIKAQIKQSQRPLVLVGSGVWWAKAEDELLQFLETARLPALTTPAARGLVPSDHALHVGAARSYALSQADLVLLLGARLNWAIGYGRAPRMSPTARIIQIDSDPGELGRNRDVNLGVVADLRTALQAMTAADVPGATSSREAWVAGVRRHHESARETLRPSLESDQAPLHPLRLCAEVRRALPRGAILVCDGGDILSFARQGLDVFRQGGWLDSGTYGIIGHGVPLGLGAKVALPSEPVLVLCGDGAFGFHAMEIETAVRERVPIVVVVSNNGGWAIERHTQLMEFGRSVAADLGPADYANLARALGAEGRRIEHPGELPSALSQALACGRPTVLDVITDASIPSPDARRQLGMVPSAQPVRFDV